MLLFAAVKVYYQCGLQATQSNMLLELFVQVVSEPCFNILRTKEQLGRFTARGGKMLVFAAVTICIRRPTQSTRVQV